MTVDQMIPGKIYNCRSTRSNFTQLVRFLGGNRIDKNLDIADPSKIKIRDDKFISIHSKWIIREANPWEISLYTKIVDNKLSIYKLI